MFEYKSLNLRVKTKPIKVGADQDLTKKIRRQKINRIQKLKIDLIGQTLTS